MKHRRRKKPRKQRRKGRPQRRIALHMQPVAPADLADAHGLLLATPAEGSDMPLIRMEVVAGGMVRLHLTDHPLNCFLRALDRRFPEDPNKLRSLAVRTLALCAITWTDECRRWIVDERDPEHVLVHPAVMEVAAGMPLNDQGGFHRVEFFRRVAEVAAAKYADADPALADTVIDAAGGLEGGEP